MLINTIFAIIIIIALIIGSYTDIKKRETPDWISYGLIAAGLGLRLLYSAITSQWMLILEGLIGFGVCFLVACLMFYSGQWGGGDAKVLMGLGAIIGLQFKADTFLLGFVIHVLFIGAVYGIIYSIVLANKHKKKFLKHFNELRQKLKTGETVIWVLFLVFPGNQRAYIYR